MSTTRSFSTMLNDFLPNELLKEELVKRDFILSKVEKDDTWLGGSLIVPFKSAGASSVAFGSLTASTDVSEDVLVRGTITTQPEVWGTMLFNQRDLMEHGKLSEQNFLKILPDAVDDFSQYMKQVVSMNLLNGSAICALSADGDASGNITVPCPDRFVIGQKLSVDDDNSSPATGYVRTINVNTGVITLYDARSGGAVVDLSGYTVAQNAAVYNDGQQSNGFTSLRSQLLSAANGGSTNLFGVAKTSSPYTQAINVLGSDVTAANIMEKIFDALMTICRLGKGKPTDVVMSYKHLGSCMKVIEASKGGYNVVAGSQSASQYGWMEIQIGSVKGMAEAGWRSGNERQRDLLHRLARDQVLLERLLPQEQVPGRRRVLRGPRDHGLPVPHRHLPVR
jgi:hypothetical protein